MKVIFKFFVRSGNAAVVHYPREEVARMLRETADRIEGGRNAGRLLDSNGNTVGQFSLTKGR